MSAARVYQLPLSTPSDGRAVAAALREYVASDDTYRALRDEVEAAQAKLTRVSTLRRAALERIAAAMVDGESLTMALDDATALTATCEVVRGCRVARVTRSSIIRRSQAGQ